MLKKLQIQCKKQLIKLITKEKNKKKYNKDNNIIPKPINKKSENSITEKLNPYKINSNNTIKEKDITKLSSQELDKKLKKQKMKCKKWQSHYIF